MVVRSNDRSCVIVGLSFGFLFISIFYFFSYCHPLLIFSSDDWNLVTITRYPIPLWGAWNPIKVLPEVLFPFTSFIGKYLIYPFCEDFVKSVTLASAFVLSSFITL